MANTPNTPIQPPRSNSPAQPPISSTPQPQQQAQLALGDPPQPKATVQQQTSETSDPLNKQSLVDALGSVMMIDYNEGERASNMVLDRLPKTLNHPQYGEVGITYLSLKQSEAANHPLHQFLHMVTRAHFNKWLPDAYFAGTSGPLMEGQSAGTLPSGKDQIWYWIPTQKLQQMYANAMKEQNARMMRSARGEKKQLDSDDSGHKGTYVERDAARIKTQAASIND